MKIYTKRGDAGQTDLLTKRVRKTDLEINVNGYVDETMAVVLMTKHHVDDPEVIDMLDTIHADLFSVAHEIALDDPLKRITTEEAVQRIEEWIDRYQAEMEPLRKFIRLDKTKAASWLNMARVTVRRAEREMAHLAETKELNPFTLALMNRLSDFFFVLGRFHNHPDKEA
jgi:cob(I)alamin adenosyltransferase